MNTIFEPSKTDAKILLTVSYLNEKHLYPNHVGVYKILSGVEDEEVEQYKDCPTYSTLISVNTKQISRLILMLVRYKYLEKIYDKETDELYLMVSEKGKAWLFDYSRKHKINLSKKAKIKEKTIVKII